MALVTRSRLGVLLLAFVATIAAADSSSTEDRLLELERLVQAQQAAMLKQQATIHDLEVASQRSLQATAMTATALSTVSGEIITADDVLTSLDHIWILLCGALVMFMQAGFAILEAGSCRAKNVQNIMLKNVMDVCVGTLGWWAFGWMFAYGEPLNEDQYVDDPGFMVSNGEVFGMGFSSADSDGNQDGGFRDGKGTTKQVNWFFQWAFSSAAATIVSGGVAERINFPGYMVYCFLMCVIIYPTVVAWTWGKGWLYQFNDVGFMDFAGSGVIHLTGGVGALVGAVLVGPRDGRFDPDRADEFDPHSMPMITLGTFILWFGWYGFNCGSTLQMHHASHAAMASQVAMNTTIAAAVGGITALMIQWAVTYRAGGLKYDLPAMCNGILAGLVSITAGCGTVECGSAFVIGMMGAFIYSGASALLKNRRILVDDPLDAFAIHGCCGAWGVLAAALFDWGKGFDYANAWSGLRCTAGEDGKCLSGAWGQLFIANLVGIIVIASWSAFASTAILLPLRVLGLLRAPIAIQDIGMDAAKHSPTKGYAMDTSELPRRDVVRIEIPEDEQAKQLTSCLKQ